MNRIVVSLCAVLAFAAAAPARAEVFRLGESDGTVHFTNAPTDPRYQRMGYSSGTAAGWLRVRGGDTSRYAGEIREAAERYGVPERLVSAVIRVESAFNPQAISRKGARGLMQLMPATASMLGVRNTFDPQENIDGGVRHLRGMIDRFANLPLAGLSTGSRGPVPSSITGSRTTAPSPTRTSRPAAGGRSPTRSTPRPTATQTVRRQTRSRNRSSSPFFTKTSTASRVPAWSMPQSTARLPSAAICTKACWPRVNTTGRSS